MREDVFSVSSMARSGAPITPFTMRSKSIIHRSSSDLHWQVSLSSGGPAKLPREDDDIAFCVVLEAVLLQAGKFSAHSPSSTRHSIVCLRLNIVQRTPSPPHPSSRIATLPSSILTTTTLPTLDKCACAYLSRHGGKVNGIVNLE